MNFLSPSSTTLGCLNGTARRQAGSQPTKRSLYIFSILNTLLCLLKTTVIAGEQFFILGLPAYFMKINLSGKIRKALNEKKKL